MHTKRKAYLLLSQSNEQVNETEVDSDEQSTPTKRTQQDKIQQITEENYSKSKPLK